MPYRITTFDWLLFAGLVVCWGSSFALSKIALQSFAPEWIVAARLFIGAAVLLMVSIFQHGAVPHDRRHIAAYTWLGFIGDAAPFFVITWGMQFITSGVAGLLMGTIPLIVIVMAHAVLPDEKINLRKAIAFTLGFAGTVILIGPENLLNIRAKGMELLGQLAVVAGCVMYGLNAVTAKQLNLRGTVQVSAGVLVAAAVMASFNAWLQSPFPAGPYPSSSVAAIVGLGLVPTGLATLIWFKAVARTGPTFIAMSNYLVPVFAVFVGAVFLDEQVGLNVMFALAFIMAGIILSHTKRIN